MPVATVDPEHYEKEDLKTLEGAYIMVRSLPYGMKLTRRDKATKMAMEIQGGKRGKDQTQKFDLETMNEWAQWYDFSYCIGDHNLTDAKGVNLDFTSQMTLKILNPKVGSEIEAIVNRYNEDEDEEKLEDFIERHTSSLPEETSTLTTPG